MINVTLKTQAPCNGLFVIQDNVILYMGPVYILQEIKYFFLLLQKICSRVQV